MNLSITECEIEEELTNPCLKLTNNSEETIMDGKSLNIVEDKKENTN